MLLVWLWVGFALDAIALAAWLVIAGIRILAGWRSRPARRRAVLDIRMLAACSAFAFACGVLGRFSFSDEYASPRAQAVVPPFGFGIVTLIAAVSVAIAWALSQPAAASVEPTAEPGPTLP